MSKRQGQVSDTGPWWRHGMMWLVLGGPAVVVVAALATAVIAIRGADTLVDESVTGSRAGRAVPTSESPAMQARNHAATAKP